MAAPAGDPMEDPTVRVVLITLILTAVLLIVALGVVYIGDEYADPAWSERSVPAPRLY
jgi:hypothetical protein